MSGNACQSQPVDATLSLNSPGIENKGPNCFPRLDQQERCPGWHCVTRSQTVGSPVEALPNQCTRWCCIHRLNPQRLSGFSYAAMPRWLTSGSRRAVQNGTTTISVARTYPNEDERTYCQTAVVRALPYVWFTYRASLCTAFGWLALDSARRPKVPSCGDYRTEASRVICAGRKNRSRGQFVRDSEGSQKQKSSMKLSSQRACFVSDGGSVIFYLLLALGCRLTSGGSLRF